MKVAVIGTGISGLTCAHLLQHDHDLRVFEHDPRAGGHAHTHTVRLGQANYRVDTGFIVYNERNYPLFSHLLDELGVATRRSDMSFAVTDERSGVEWRGSTPSSIFAQPKNLARPAFLAMLSDVARFNREARQLLNEPVDHSLTLESFLSRRRWSRGFLDWYLIPMGAAIWSADPHVFADFPAHAFARFFHNHGLLGLGDRPEWRTVIGGSANYVSAITNSLGSRLSYSNSVTKLVRRRSSVELVTSNGEVEHFDHVIVATHADQALSLLADPTSGERDVLSAIRFRRNVATLHSDAALLPTRTRARASWNWRQGPVRSAPILTYDLSRLQGLDTPTPLCLSLNAHDAIRPDAVIDRMTYAHPIYDPAAMRAQLRHGEISGHDGVSYAGAYWGYGFHEDGARSALNVCQNLGVSWPGVTP